MRTFARRDQYMIQYPKIPLAQSVLRICLAEGLTDIVISPGSRNAPLTIGFAGHPDFRCFSIADERCAAFFAIGRAQQLGKPVAVVCTSGSALLNYYPAFAEAFYSEIPLVVISADRPHDKIDIGDGQTIRQENVFANHSLYNANLTEDASVENDRLITEAIRTAVLKKGPVHLNVPFEEPLYETVSEWTVVPTVFDREAAVRPEPELDYFTAQWNTAHRKLVLAGSNAPGALQQEAIDFIASDPSVVVMTETISNLHHPHFITDIDVFITPFGEAEFEAFRPDILLTFGGMVISKRVKAWLRKYPPRQHWHVDTLRAYDTFGVLSHHLVMTPADFFSVMAGNVTRLESDYQTRALSLSQYRDRKRTDFMENVSYSDLKVYKTVYKAIPSQSILHISNSAAIRYSQLFASPSGVAIFCNRGTSGIDGSTSTAIGAATAAGQRVTLVTGDIGFFYDSNALWNQYIPKDFRIILVNNGGGGIFRILPGHSETPLFHTYFETAHTLTARHLAAMYGFGYRAACNDASLDEAMEGFFDDAGQPQLLEVFTPSQENDKVLSAFFKALV